MPRSITLAALLLAAALGGACSDDPEPITAPSPPVSVVETFADTLNPNGGKTHVFAAERAGLITARLISLTPETETTIGLSLGTWNGTACNIIIANDNASLTNSAVIGSATGTGVYCVRLYDVGKLTQNADYSVTVEHF